MHSATGTTIAESEVIDTAARPGQAEDRLRRTCPGNRPSQQCAAHTRNECSACTGSVWKLSDAEKACPHYTLLDPRDRALATIAHFAITAYTQRGDIVLDADGRGLPTIMAEAHTHERNCTADPDYSAEHIASQARRNARRTKPHRSPRTFPEFLESGHRVGLAILTASVEMPTNSEHGELAEATSMRLTDTCIRRLYQCRSILKPGSTLVAYTPRFRHGGELVDVPGLTIAALRQYGFTPIDRRVVVLDTPPGSEPHQGTDAGRCYQLRAARPVRRRFHHPIHEDLIVATVAA